MYLYIFISTTGTYLGFDESLPTSESGGKGKVISSLKKKHQTYVTVNIKAVLKCIAFRIVMVGDGITDLESCPPAVSVCSAVLCVYVIIVHSRMLS